MSIDQTVRAWKDPDFADALAEAGIATRPSPAGVVGSALDDAELARVAGGQWEVPKTMLGPWVCIAAGVTSAMISCLRCDNSIWDGTCGAASIGCCPNET